MGLFRFLSFKEAKQPVTDGFSFIGTDMHNHLLPNLDDGSSDVEDSVRFIRQLYILGYRKLICTPHIISEVYPNSQATIEPAYQLLRQRLAAEQIEVELGFSAEFMVNIDFVDLVNDNQLLPFGQNHLLIEMSYLAPSPNIREVIFDLIIKGFQPILAHPERYAYYHQRFEVIREFARSGCLLQVNLLSLTGYYGKEVKRVAEQLIREKMVSFAGTDLHHERHLALLQKLTTDRKMMELLHSIEWKNKLL